MRSGHRDEAASVGRAGVWLYNFCAGVLLVVMTWLSAAAKTSNRQSDAELAAITARGVFLAEYDTAVSQATDAVTAIHPVEGRVERYIGRKTDAGWIIDFGRLSTAANKFFVSYEAIQTSDPTRFEVKEFNPQREDTGWNLAAAKAIEAVTKDLGATSRPYNIAVLPAEGGRLYVYLYLAQVKEGVYPLGADVRYRLSPDGMKILEKHQMHQSVIESVPGDARLKVTTGYHTHVLSDIPEDTDVMLVLNRRPRVPEIVITPSFMYTIGGDGKIVVADRPRR